MLITKTPCRLRPADLYGAFFLLLVSFLLKRGCLSILTWLFRATHLLSNSCCHCSKPYPLLHGKKVAHSSRNWNILVDKQSVLIYTQLELISNARILVISFIPMVLYIDETENEQYFIVAGLLAASKEQVVNAYKRFKKHIKGFTMPAKYKAKVFTEFKSHWLDNEYQGIKRKMLYAICAMDDVQILYAAYKKDKQIFDQKTKESVYIQHLTSIVRTIASPASITFDAFGKKDFEDRIVSIVGSLDNAESIAPADSQLEPGLQFIDNICSVIRLHISSDPRDRYYEMLDPLIVRL